MKKNILITGLANILGIASGLIFCSPDYETEFKVETLAVPDKSQVPITFLLLGGEHGTEAQINVPLDRWNAQSNAEWCKVVRHEGKVVVSASADNIYKQRRAEITVAYGHQSYSITASQSGKEPATLIGDKLQQEGYAEIIDAERETLTIPVATNLNLDNITILDTCNWIRLAEQPATSDAKTCVAEDVNRQELKFTLDKNTETDARYCTITPQSSQNYSYIVSFLIKQQSRGYIVEIDEDKKIYKMRAMGETITIPFKVNSPVGEVSHTYEVEEFVRSWITPVSLPASGALRGVPESFITKANTEVENQPREGRITFKSTNSTDKIPSQFVVTVRQVGFITTPPLNMINTAATPGVGNIQLQWEIPEDVDFNKIKITYHDKVTKENKEILINGYKTTFYIIDDTYQCTGKCSFTINTCGPTGMETDSPVTITGISGRASEMERVTPTIDMLSDNANHVGDGGGLLALIDGKVNIYYHTEWNAPVTTEAHHVQIKLNKSLRDFRFEYDARQSGVNNGGDVKATAIYGSMNGGFFKNMGSEEFNLPTTNGGHATAKNNVDGEQAYNYIRFTPTARRDKDPLDYTVVGSTWWNMSEIYLYRIRHDEAWARERLGT